MLTPTQSNVLVNINGRALITDPGLVMVTQSLDSAWGTADECAGSVRWVAPEILGGWGTYSKEGDIFSLAMVTIEVFMDDSRVDPCVDVVLYPHRYSLAQFHSWTATLSRLCYPYWRGGARHDRPTQLSQIGCGY